MGQELAPPDLRQVASEELRGFQLLPPLGGRPDPIELLRLAHGGSHGYHLLSFAGLLVSRSVNSRPDCGTSRSMPLLGSLLLSPSAFTVYFSLPCVGRTFYRAIASDALTVAGGNSGRQSAPREPRWVLP